MNIVDYAFMYAARAHAGQFRKYTGEPYIEHPRRVAERLKALNKEPCIVPVYYGDESIAAALLHDVVEDCGVSCSTLGRDFSARVSLIVQGLTNVSKDVVPHLNRAERKLMDNARLSSQLPVVQSIKLADRIDNLLDMVGADDGFKRLYIKESKDLLNVLTKADPRLRELLEATIRQVDPDNVSPTE